MICSAKAHFIRKVIYYLFLPVLPIQSGKIVIVAYRNVHDIIRTIKITERRS